MDKIQRYSVGNELGVCDTGGFCLYSDVEHLEQQNKKLRDALEGAIAKAKLIELHAKHTGVRYDAQCIQMISKKILEATK